MLAQYFKDDTPPEVDDDKEIYLSDLKDIEKLSVHPKNNEIEDITEIEHMENLNKLRFLDLANNNIENIDPVKNLNNLEVLNLSDNETKLYFIIK